jgi:uncharacterized protein (DUF608 family)
MVYQLFARTADRKILDHFYDSAKRAIKYQYTLDDDGCGLVHEQPHVRPGEAWPANQFYDVWPWEGVSSYVAGTWLATLSAGLALARAAQDEEFAIECSNRLEKAQGQFEQQLWNGKYYRLWNNAAAGRRSDVCLANQLMGVWCSRVAGLDDVLRRERVRVALDSIERLNMKATAYGVVNGVTSEGTPFRSGYNGEGDFGPNIFFGESLCAAMTLLYAGRSDAGLEVTRRLYETVAVKTRSPWNQRCLLHGDSGLPLWGDDYYSNMAIWAVPMAVEQSSVERFTRAGIASKIQRSVSGSS